jgi:PAS domain S-box-containing protein
MYESAAGQVRPLSKGAPAAVLTSGAYVTLFAGQASVLNRRRASQVAGLAAMAIGAAALAGWWAPVPLLSGLGPDFARVKPTTALCLTALGLALVHPGRNSRFALAVGVAVAAIAVFDLLDRFGVDFGIDRLNGLLVPRTVEPGAEASFREINGVPVSLSLAGSALALSCFERRHFAALALGCLVAVTQVYGVLAYLSGIHTLYGAIATPRPPTDVGLLCVAVAIVLRTGAMSLLREPRPMGHLLILLGCAIIAPLLLFGLYTGLRITDAQLDEVRKELIDKARTLSAEVDREISGEIKRLQALAASPALSLGDFAEFQRQASLASPREGNIVLVNRDMRQLVNTKEPLGTPKPKVTIRETIEKTLASGKPHVTGLFMGGVSRRLLFAVVVPVEVGGENRYALVAAPGPHPFAGLLAAQELPPDWHAVVSDAAHCIIAGSDEQEAAVGKELPRARWRRSEPAEISESVDDQGRPSLEAYAWSELTGWETAVWASRTQLEAPVRALWWTIGLTALTAFALTVALAAWLGRLIAGSVGLAAHAATALGEGGPLSLNRTPVAEVNTLMEELRGAATRRQAAEHELQASKDRLQLAFDATRLGWWQFDPLRHMISGDARFKELFDVTPDEISVDDLMTRIHPDDVERFRMNREAALNPANPEPYLYHQYRVRRRDGSIRWVEAYALAYFEGVGRERRVVSFGGTVQDITERKEREDKEQLLMREINHRAKNMLSVVDSIAHQTAARSPEEFVERFSERVQALSANQDLLVRNEWQGVDVEDLVRAQLAHFADLIGSRIALHGPRLRLNPAAAQAIGLALHELATNAGKYGALSTDAGRVDIDWRMSDGNTFDMSWTEHGGPPVSAPQRRGFGAVVIEAMAERSVGGGVSLDYAPSGVIWRLTCPAANALDPGAKWKP